MKSESMPEINVICMKDYFREFGTGLDTCACFNCEMQKMMEYSDEEME